MSASSLERLEHLQVFAELDSTNTYLMKSACPPPGRFRVALAEQQTAGRGRMDRTWQSPRGAGLYMSVSYTFVAQPSGLPSLTLAIGIAVVQSLEKLGIRGIGLKWPNDIVACDGKAGGILTEVVPAKTPNVTIVAGIGLNVDLGVTGRKISIPGKIGAATDLRCCSDNLPDRAAIAVALTEQLFDALPRFEKSGFRPFYDKWQRYDWLRGQQVCMETAGESVCGKVQGIEPDGAITIKADGGCRSFHSGNVSLVA